MENIFKNPKSTLLGILVAVVFGLVAMLHDGRIDLSSLPNIAAVIPILSTLILGALSTDNSALVKLFFEDWKTTAIGIGSAIATAVLGTLANGKLDNKILARSAVAAIFGWVSTHKDNAPLPPYRPPERLQ